MNLSRRSIALGLAAQALHGPFSVSAQPAPVPLPSRSTETGGVRITVRPLKVAAGQSWEFEIVLDTHTRPLDDDLTEGVVLVSDAGLKFAATSWSGDKPGGHHRKGVLHFPAPAEPVRFFELQIEDLAGTGKRTFRWSR